MAVVSRGFWALVLEQLATIARRKEDSMKSLHNRLRPIVEDGDCSHECYAYFLANASFPLAQSIPNPSPNLGLLTLGMSYTLIGPKTFSIRLKERTTSSFVLHSDSSSLKSRR